ncbi:MAG: cache domain-containing protein [Candidatus Thiodiazotropha sp. (ex Dulcina madagascariensis)]|nr:cache domain-containing protein [Candidatus Thiodiazotropha sp. (ex Dulcina madagascariensis)]MCU7928387.1 cache domain-containing protein [Candidatus Thiodiazotropha sp. (ex Dulcina madagascariensis)]
MNPLFRVIQAIRSSLRYKLLVLVLFPILLMMPIALGLAVYWGSQFSYDQLFIKVNTDLSVAEDNFNRIQEDYLNTLGRLAESHAFLIALESRSGQVIDAQLAELRQTAGFTYLHLLGMNGKHLFRFLDEKEKRGHPSPSLLAALQGFPRVEIEIFSAADLDRQTPGLAKQVALPLLDTPRARPTKQQIEDRGMMIRALYPVKNSRGQVVAVLDGGVLLNGNFKFVDAIRDLVYGPGSLPKGSIGTVTVFLNDVRITTNVPRTPHERALGTRVSDEVRTQVLDHGEKWIDRAFVVNDWYISAYQPIIDVNGERVGMLYAGFLESPSRNALWQALGVLILLFLALMFFSSLLSVKGAKSIFKPLEMMMAVVRATREGYTKRIGEIASKDEIGVLANEFDLLLDLLQERNLQVQQWADQLEEKVEERTTELQRKNEKLLTTIQVLRETRAQLIAAEKLAALGELTAGVAHEINNPAAVMLGNLDLLVEELGADAAPVQNEIDLIIEQIFRIKDIINNLLQYARPDQLTEAPSLIDVNEVVQHTLALVRYLRKKSYFEIKLDLNATRPIKINPHELQQVLVNLVVNAVHALRGEGQVCLSTRDWEAKGVVIEIEDNGIGIEEDQLELIFNPFHTRKREGEGTGLGLSVSYGLIKKYGGNITASSELGKGSLFSVWLLEEPDLMEEETALMEQYYIAEQEVADMDLSATQKKKSA